MTDAGISKWMEKNPKEPDPEVVGIGKWFHWTVMRDAQNRGGKVVLEELNGLAGRMWAGPTHLRGKK